MGNEYAQALSKGLKHMSPEVVRLSDNRLTPHGSFALVSKLKAGLKHLDLSHNVIGNLAIQKLADFIKTKAIGWAHWSKCVDCVPSTLSHAIWAIQGPSNYAPNSLIIRD